MTIPALLLLLAVAPQNVVIERSVRVPAADMRSLHFSVRNRPATIAMEYKVQRSVPVRLILMAQADEARFRAGRAVTEIGRTDFQSAGSVKTYVATPGEYVVVVDNRAAARDAAMVELRGTLSYDMTPRAARQLSGRTRVAVIATSLMFFLTIVWGAGRPLWAAMLGRRKPEPPLA